MTDQQQICCGVPMLKLDDYCWACEQCPGMILLPKPEESTYQPDK